MAENDLHLFLEKVKHLNQMVDSLDEFPERRRLLKDCTDHNQVVQLARSWGYEIGRRWGELSYLDSTPLKSNLLRLKSPLEGQERKLLLKGGEKWRLELIISCSAKSPVEGWYNQSQHEWFVLLRGSARLRFKSPDENLDLSVGDYMYLSPHRLHRVERTDPSPGTTWLSLLWSE